MTSGPYRSFKEIRSNRERVVFVDAVHRLYWTLSGTFPSSISVMTNRRGGLEPREPLSKADGTWHEIASLSITEPKVSSIEVSIDNFRDWEYEWVIRHQEHAGAEFVTYGDLDDETRPYASEQYEDGSWESDSDKEFLIRCCGQDRPIRKNELKLLVEPSPGEDYVTIQSYITGISTQEPSLKLNRHLTAFQCSCASVADELTREHLTVDAYMG